VADQERTAEEVLKVAAAIEQARKKRTALQNESEADNAARAALEKEIQQLVGSMTKLGLIETSRAELQQLPTEIAGFSNDLPAQVLQAEVRVSEKEEAQRVLPFLSRIARQRTELIADRRSHLDLAKQFEAITELGKQLSADVTRLEECVRKKA